MNDIGLVLGGGGAKGAYQIGAWKAITQMGLDSRIKAYSGASIGAINSCLMQISDIGQATRIWLNYNLEKIFISDNISYYEILETIKKIQRNKEIDFDGLLDREGLIRLFYELHIENLSLSNKDFYVSVVNVTDIPENLRSIKPALDWYEKKKVGKTQYINIKNMNTQDVINILLASSALPVIYPPVEMYNQYYVDGGINEDLPIFPLYQAGYRKIIAIPCGKVNYYNIKKIYPNADILIIQPTANLGNLLNGTLNFNKERLRQSYKIGYLNALNSIRRSGFANI